MRARRRRSISATSSDIMSVSSLRPAHPKARLRFCAIRWQGAVEARTLARSPVPGPVHLNARARKPLEFSFRAEGWCGCGVGLRVGGPFVGLPVSGREARMRLRACRHW